MGKVNKVNKLDKNVTLHGYSNDAKDKVTKLQCRQDRYTDKTFQESLCSSQELVSEVAQIARDCGFSTREGDDKNPFTTPNGKSFRLWDICLLENKEPYRQFNVEVKDFASSLAYTSTGLPRSYIDKKMMLSNGGKNLILVFRQNVTWIAKYSENKNIPIKDVVDNLVKMGFIKRTTKDIDFFVPYGNILSVLMDKGNRDLRAEDRVSSKLNAYYGEKQYMWKLSAMMPIDKLFKSLTSLSDEPEFKL